MKTKDIPVVILCGGLGTRLREETQVRPKPMVEIGHAPILWHIIKGYSHYGFHRFVLCLGYKGEVIKEFFRNYETWGEDITINLNADGSVTHEKNTFRREPLKITLVETGPETMTGGRIAGIRDYIDTDTFMATYGDGVADINFEQELAFHYEHGRHATLAIMNPRSRFGVVDCSDNGVVEQFREKPMLENWVNGGFYVFNKEVFDYLEPNCVLEVEPLERLTREKQLMGFRHSGCWETMDTYRDYLALNQLWENNQAGWKVWDD